MSSALVRTPYSEQDAARLILAFVRYGSHIVDKTLNANIRDMSDGGIIAVLKLNGFPWDKAITELRADHSAIVEWFENLWSNTNNEVEGRSIRITQYVFDVPYETIDLDGKAVLRLEYLSQFIAACDARDRAIETASIDEIYTMLTKTFTSIDAFVNTVAFVHNHKRPDAQQLLDGEKGSKFVSLEDKLTRWLPTMGVPVDATLLKSLPAWQVLRKLKSIRDKGAVHPKMQGARLALAEIAEVINDFRILAELLFQLHRWFGNQEVDRHIIRACRYPQIVVA